jgi:hypothetical protein
VTCLRIAAGFNAAEVKSVEATLKKGDLVFGKLAKPNPLPPVKYYWHIHHESLFEVLREPIENRVCYIRENKPLEEVETRLRLLHEVKDVKTLKLAIIQNDYETLEQLHQKECPDCPWSNEEHTIFPNPKPKTEPTAKGTI